MASKIDTQTPLVVEEDSAIAEETSEVGATAEALGNQRDETSAKVREVAPLDTEERIGTLLSWEIWRG